MTRLITRTSLILVLLFVSLPLILFFLPAPPLLTGVSFSQAVVDEQGRLLRVTLSQDGKFRLQTPITQLSPMVVQATLLQEDQFFSYHVGVNPVSLVKAVWNTYVSGPRRIGASTITMQVARMRYQLNTKTVSGKLQQILYALRLEAHYRKPDILQAYLNLAPYGNNIEGVSAASWIYFNKPASTLTLPEALTLVVIPQNPTKRIHDCVALKMARDKLFVRWLQQHPEDQTKAFLLGLPLALRHLQAAPFLAPHFVNTVLHQASLQKNATTPPPSTINTTLNLALQQIVERIVQQYLARKKNIGVNNAAVLVLDARDMSVKAMLGSANFFDAAVSGQINGTQVKRSPGSTLKPFIYGLALDQGLIHPNTLLKDVPHSFGSYNPENFDSDFMGPLKAKEALTLSRNIPAIALTEQLTHPTLYQFLQQAQVSLPKSESYYGLALALGGAELSMQELVSLYAMLANEGLWQPLRLQQEEAAPRTPQVSVHGGRNVGWIRRAFCVVIHRLIAWLVDDDAKSASNPPHPERLPPQSQRLLSPEASYLVLEMLKETRSVTGTFAARDVSSNVAWKTGTSSGYRDAWTIGVVGKYVIAVWVGDFTNRSNPAFVGKEVAAPLFFEVLAALKGQLRSIQDNADRVSGLNIKQVDVCKVSGMLPTPYCLETEKTWFIPGKSPIKTDTIHREVAINSVTGLRTCHIDANTQFAVYEFWPSDLLKIFKQAGIQRKTPPPYEADCVLNATASVGFSPQITSPQMQMDYIARVSAEKPTRIPLAAVVDADVHTLHWFVDASYLGKTARDQPMFWSAVPGKHVIRVVDEYGRSDVRRVTVKLA